VASNCWGSWISTGNKLSQSRYVDSRT
jgi:hypothetical protein